MTQDMIILGFDRIIEQLKSYAVSSQGRQKLDALAPIMNESLCRARMEETTAALAVLQGAGSPPLSMMTGLEEALAEALRGGMLLPAQLAGAAVFAASVGRLARYLRQAAAFSAGIASWSTALPDLRDLQAEIESAIHEDSILDEASPTLRDLRRSREFREQAIREKLNHVLQHHREKLADGYITQRGGHFVLPVQRRWQGQFPGRVLDASAKGGTVFMEPNAVASLQAELDAVLLQIDTEERRILWSLSDRLAAREEDIRRCMETMAELDALFARARLSEAMHARPVTLTA